MPDEYASMFGEPVSGWFRWFAWRPVETVDRGWRWLRPVWRRRVHKHSYLTGGTDWWFQHAVRVNDSILEQENERLGKELDELKALNWRFQHAVRVNEQGHA